MNWVLSSFWQGSRHTARVTPTTRELTANERARILVREEAARVLNCATLAKEGSKPASYAVGKAHPVLCAADQISQQGRVAPEILGGGKIIPVQDLCRTSESVHAPERVFLRIGTIALEEFLEVIDRPTIDLDAEFPRCGGTLLTWAAKSHRSDLVEMLLERGADHRKATRVDGWDALQWAVNTSVIDNAKNCDREATIRLLKPLLEGALEGVGAASNVGSYSLER